MRLKQVLSRTHSSESQALVTPRKHTPWIDSPLEPSQFSRSNTPPEHDHEAKTPHERTHTLNFSLPHHHHDPDHPPFKHRHESSTVELFYDLFFVANLATFTSNHDIVDADSLKNYIGFFTILWFTWLETSLFDVRFAGDSVFNRLCKAVSFGVMTGFAVTGAIYDTSNVGENVKAFRALSIILMVSRLALVVQYGVVFLYVKRYPKTWAPLLGTMAALLISAIIFLGTFFGYNIENTGESFPNQSGGPKTYVAYYVVVCVEALAVITISCCWRVVSFKHTHLVERIGLLTLIIMGEGIIGMSKSVSQILQNSSSTSGSDIGVIVSSVLLIYFIWVLYFDQIENDRFGTIRQQIWAILHYPLHVAIVLTVEGSTTLILWNIIVHTNNALWYWYPVYYLSDYKKYYKSAQDLVNYLSLHMEEIAHRFKSGALEEAYNYKQNLTSILDLKEPFGTEKWEKAADDIVYDMFTGINNFIFENFGIELPENDAHSHSKGGEQAKNNAFYNVFNTVYLYFYLAAGFFLVILAIMYWFGKKHKSRGEWASIGVRVVAGIGITMTCLADYYTATDSSSYSFLGSAWLIPIVMIGYFLVIVADNLLVWHTNTTIAKMTSADNEHGHGKGHGRSVGSVDGVSSKAEPVMRREQEQGRTGDHNV